MKYLIAVDSSDNSRYAFNQAKKKFFTPKDHVYILTVTESPTAYPFEDLLNFSSESYTEMNRKIEQMYAELLKKYGRKLTKASVPHTCLLARGTIKDVICRQAQDLCVDVVIMGRRGLGTLERTFIGSTSQYCVHNLNCSVMVIPLVQDEKVLTKSSEEIAREISKEEENECTDEKCGDEECAQHGSKFKKIGQYEREKWGKKEEKEFPQERLSEPVASDVAEKNLPIKSEGKKNKRKNKNNKGNVGKSAGKWEDVTLDKEKSKKEAKEEFPSEELPKEAFPITDEELKEQKKKLVHEEGSIDVVGEEEKEIKFQKECKGKLEGKEFSPKEVSKESKEGKFKGKAESKLEKIQERISGGESPKEKEIKHEGGAGKFERLKEPISGGESPKESKIDRSKEEKQPTKNLQEKECNDPLCNNKECPKHGTEELKKRPKWQGKVHEKKECNDPKCNNSECPKHGKKSKEEVKGVEKSFAEVVSSSVGEKGKESPKIIEKSEHKAAINIGEGKVEGKVESKKDDEGKWKGSIGVGYKGKDEKGQEYEGKHYEASIQSTK